MKQDKPQLTTQINLRADEATARLLAQLSYELHLSKAKVVRLALEEYASRHSVSAALPGAS